MLLDKGIVGPLAFSPGLEGPRASSLYACHSGRVASTWVVLTSSPQRKKLMEAAGSALIPQTEPVLDLALSRGLVPCFCHSFLVPLFVLLK